MGKSLSQTIFHDRASFSVLGLDSLICNMYYICNTLNGNVAQLAEQPAFNRLAVGSSPAIPSFKK